MTHLSSANALKRCCFQHHMLRTIRRCYATEVDGAGTSTGIEHALKFNQIGQTNKQDFQAEYKCIEYLHQNTYSYYDIECKMQEFRCPQPSNKQPDTEPKFKSQ